ncbi:hypothetical protein SUNI508_05472 [Seiridium unicorne]|uniref:Uncharacterized protein n=1 Tax=Seiridium unicorne TaxID=138068 RepID=A0ABR2V5Q1_9PEZI
MGQHVFDPGDLPKMNHGFELEREDVIDIQKQLNRMDKLYYEEDYQRLQDHTFWTLFPKSARRGQLAEENNGRLYSAPRTIWVPTQSGEEAVKRVLIIRQYRIGSLRQFLQVAKRILDHFIQLPQSPRKTPPASNFNNYCNYCRNFDINNFNFDINHPDYR